jgi:hypothetical protein
MTRNQNTIRLESYFPCLTLSHIVLEDNHWINFYLRCSFEATGFFWCSTFFGFKLLHRSDKGSKKDCSSEPGSMLLSLYLIHFQSTLGANWVVMYYCYTLCPEDHSWNHILISCYNNITKVQGWLLSDWQNTASFASGTGDYIHSFWTGKHSFACVNSACKSRKKQDF